MKHCPECGGELEYYGLSGWSSGVWLSGCPKCNIRWEEHGSSLTGRMSSIKKGHISLSEWKKREEEKKEKEKEEEKKIQEKLLEEKRKKRKTKGWPEPVNLTKEVIGSLNNEQKEVLKALSELAEKEKEICDKINVRQPNRTGVVVVEGGVTVCEDKDDFIVITAGLRQELEKVRNEIKKKLEEALDLDLVHLGIIQRQCLNYGVNL